MLEPLHTCNLACLGCSPERYSGDLKDRLSLAQCLEAVDEAGAPVVSICGGEPTIYPELPELVDAIIARKRHIYLCTNGLLLDRFYKQGQPHKRLSINVHLDGMRATHDFITDRPGTFDRAIEMIKEGKRRGYAVCTNTTIFRETSMDEIEEMCALLTGHRRRRHAALARLPLRGHQGGPLPPSRRDPPEVHSACSSWRSATASRRRRCSSQFAAGQRDYPCTPWGNPTRTPKGWKGPCYLIEGEYYATWKDFWGGVDWDYWESRQDPRCQNCFMHSGFEPSVVRKLGESPRDVWTMARWNLGA